MAAVVIAIARAPYQKKSILTSRAVFATMLPRIGFINGNSGSTGCVRRGMEEYAIIFLFFCIHLCFLKTWSPRGNCIGCSAVCVPMKRQRPSKVTSKLQRFLAVTLSYLV